MADTEQPSSATRGSSSSSGHGRAAQCAGEPSVLAIGMGCAFVAGRVSLWLLSTVAQVDRGAARLGIRSSLERLGVSSVAHLLARLLRWSIVLLAFVAALFSLDPRLASDLREPSSAVSAAPDCRSRPAPGRGAAQPLFRAQRPDRRGEPRGALGAAARGATRLGILLVTVAVALEQTGIGRSPILDRVRHPVRGPHAGSCAGGGPGQPGHRAALAGAASGDRRRSPEGRDEDPARVRRGAASGAGCQEGPSAARADAAPHASPEGRRTPMRRRRTRPGSAPSVPGRDRQRYPVKPVF